MSEQAQQKLPLPALFKLDNQVQSGGAGEEWVGPEGRGGPDQWKQGNGGGGVSSYGADVQGFGRGGVGRTSA